MSTYYVEVTAGVRSPNVDLEAVIDPLMNAFEDLIGVTDVDLGIDLGKRTLTISMYVDADTEGAAINDAVAVAEVTLCEVGVPQPGSFHSVVKRANLVDS